MQRPLVSSKSIILKISRDLNLGEREIPWQDMLEWIGEGLQHIGATGQLVAKTSTIAIFDYQGYLPEDFFSSTSQYPSTVKIQGNTLHASFKEGFVDFSYLAFPLDDEGFPLVPDNVSYATALFWKVAMQLSIRGQLPNKELSYAVCKSRWDWYCKQAGTQGLGLDKNFFARYAAIFSSPIPFVGIPISSSAEDTVLPRSPETRVNVIPAHPVAKPQV